MIALPKPLVESRLELLCQKGCRLVWHDIAVLERGEELAETLDLDPVERAWLLQELRSIMLVYGERCSVD